MIAEEALEAQEILEATGVALMTQLDAAFDSVEKLPEERRAPTLWQIYPRLVHTGWAMSERVASRYVKNEGLTFIEVIPPDMGKMSSNLGYALNSPSPRKNLLSSLRAEVFDGYRKPVVRSVEVDRLRAVEEMRTKSREVEAALKKLQRTADLNLLSLDELIKESAYSPRPMDQLENIPGASYARFASQNACGFCRVMAIRGPVYSYDTVLTPKFSQNVKSSFHRNCRCLAVISTPDNPYEPPSFVDKWTEDYEKVANTGTPKSNRELVLKMEMAGNGASEDDIKNNWDPKAKKGTKTDSK